MERNCWADTCGSTFGATGFGLLFSCLNSSQIYEENQQKKESVIRSSNDNSILHYAAAIISSRNRSHNLSQ